MKPEWLIKFLGTLEHDLQLTYGDEECATFEYTKRLRDRVRLDSVNKMNDAGEDTQRQDVLTRE